MVLFLSTSLFAQNKVTGVVKDNIGPAVGVSVIEQGTTNGTITDIDGKFTLTVQNGAQLVISSVGYKNQVIEVGDKTTFEILIEEDSELLDEVVVVGYGVQKKKLVTGSTVQVKGSDLAKLNTTNPLAALQSQTPGVQITQKSAQPGSSFKVYIRGVGTTGNSDPLYVIDGVPGGNMDNINPADIESIDVLKDAASSAIYGARAANGVILVTTKQGKEGKITATYDGYVGISNPYKKPALLNAQEYMTIVDEYNWNVYGEKTNWNNQVPQYILDKVAAGWKGTDWFDEYVNSNAVQHNHSFGLQGGNNKSKFSMNLGYTHNDGIMGKPLQSKYDRLTGRINSDHVLLHKNGLDIIKIGENVSGWYTKNNNLAENNMYWNSFHQVMIASPLLPVYAEDGTPMNFNRDGAGWSMYQFMNPKEGLLNGMFNSINDNRSFGFGATLFLDIEPIKGLKYHGQFHGDWSGNTWRQYQMPYSVSQTDKTNSRTVTNGASLGSNWSVQNTISYKIPEFAGNNIDVMIGQEFQKMAWGMSISGSGSVDDGKEKSTLTDLDHAWLDNMSFDTIKSVSSSPWGESALASFFGRINYNYKEKYMATVTVRGDGSSNFARGKRWGIFPSVSAGWVMTNEPWMKGAQGVLDFFKIRGSWGQNGNCNIANFQYVSAIAYSDAYYSNGYQFNSDPNQIASSSAAPTMGAYSPLLPNPDVTWETSEQLDFGFDARMFNNRLGINFDWYNKATRDWLVVAPSPAVNGTGAPFVNAGDVENKGFELAFSWNDKAGQDFYYHGGISVAYNKNVVTKMGTPGGRINGPVNILAQGVTYMYRAEVGHPIGYFYGMSTDGVWQTQEQIDKAVAAGQAVLPGAQPGDLIWVDYDKNGIIDLDADRHEIGDPNPNVILGLNFGFEWKGLDFSLAGHGAFGQQIMQSYRGVFPASWYENFTTDIFGRWHGAGTSNRLPRLSAGADANWITVSDIYMQKGDFFKLQNVTLGYDFNKLWKNSPFGQLRLYVQAQNLFTITKYTGMDPEIGSSAGYDAWAGGIDLGLHPTARTYIAGVSIKF